ncbi:hypothetical protein D770_25685 [Flammeovirgaceae bacterium 311]|nr:hypothetical protein D770_25685 [Flammeovirgaceae bacterium 311]
MRAAFYIIIQVLIPLSAYCQGDRIRYEYQDSYGIIELILKTDQTFSWKEKGYQQGIHGIKLVSGTFISEGDGIRLNTDKAYFFKGAEYFNYIDEVVIDKCCGIKLKQYSAAIKAGVDSVTSKNYYEQVDFCLLSNIECIITSMPYLKHSFRQNNYSKFIWTNFRRKEKTIVLLDDDGEETHLILEKK